MCKYVYVLAAFEEYIIGELNIRKNVDNRSGLILHTCRKKSHRKSPVLREKVNQKSLRANSCSTDQENFILRFTISWKKFLRENMIQIICH